MFADRVRDYVARYYPDYIDFVGHVAIARPFRSNHKDNNFHINFNKDPLLNQLRETSLNETPYPNVELSKNCPIKIPYDGTYVNHEFKCYTGNTLVKGILTFPPGTASVTAQGYVADSIYRIASSLGNNDDDCCSRKPGKLWLNYGTELGGFVSNNIKVTGGDIYVASGAQLCGEGVIEASEDVSKHSFGELTKIDGKIDLRAPFRFNGISKTLKGSTFELKGSHENNVLDATVLTVEGNVKIDMTSEEPESLNNFVTIVNSVFGIGDHFLKGRMSIYNSDLKNYTNVTSKTSFDFSELKVFEDGKFSFIGDGNIVYTNIYKNFKVESPDTHAYGLTINGDTDLSSKKVFLRFTDFFGTSKISSDNLIEISEVYSRTSVDSLTGECSDSITIQNSQIKAPFSFSSCEILKVMRLNTDGELSTEGSLRLQGTVTGGGSIKTASNFISEFVGEIGGEVNIDAPKGFVLGNLYSGHLDLPGNFSLISTCSEKVQLDLNSKLPYTDHSFSFHPPGKARKHCETGFDGTFNCYEHFNFPDC